MTRARIWGVCAAAVLVLSGLTAGPAAAKTVLTLETAAGPLGEGANIVMSSSNLRLAKSDGNIECTSNVFSGSVSTNGLAKDTASFTEASLTGPEPQESCKDTDPQGPAKMSTSGFPWIESLKPSGMGTLKGSKKIVFKEIQIFAGPSTCVFEAATVKETFHQHVTTAEPLVIEVSSQPFKLARKASNAACPQGGRLSGTFSVQSGGETVLAHT
jgi:hypothetical protein